MIESFPWIKNLVLVKVCWLGPFLGQKEFKNKPPKPGRTTFQKGLFGDLRPVQLIGVEKRISFLNCVCLLKSLNSL